MAKQWQSWDLGEILRYKALRAYSLLLNNTSMQEVNTFLIRKPMLPCVIYLYIKSCSDEVAKHKSVCHEIPEQIPYKYWHYRHLSAGLYKPPGPFLAPNDHPLL
jgi:hypothetical protein